MSHIRYKISAVDIHPAKRDVGDLLLDDALYEGLDAVLLRLHKFAPTYLDGGIYSISNTMYWSIPNSMYYCNSCRCRLRAGEMNVYLTPQFDRYALLSYNGTFYMNDGSVCNFPNMDTKSDEPLPELDMDTLVKGTCLDDEYKPISDPIYFKNEEALINAAKRTIISRTGDTNVLINDVLGAKVIDRQICAVSKSDPTILIHMRISDPGLKYDTPLTVVDEKGNKFNGMARVTEKDMFMSYNCIKHLKTHVNGTNVISFKHNRFSTIEAAIKYYQGIINEKLNTYMLGRVMDDRISFAYSLDGPEILALYYEWVPTKNGDLIICDDGKLYRGVCVDTIHDVHPNVESKPEPKPDPVISKNKGDSKDRLEDFLVRPRYMYSVITCSKEFDMDAGDIYEFQSEAQADITIRYHMQSKLSLPDMSTITSERDGDNLEFKVEVNGKAYSIKLAYKTLRMRFMP